MSFGGLYSSLPVNSNLQNTNVLQLGRPRSIVLSQGLTNPGLLGLQNGLITQTPTLTNVGLTLPVQQQQQINGVVRQTPTLTTIGGLPVQQQQINGIVRQTPTLTTIGGLPVQQQQINGIVRQTPTLTTIGGLPVQQQQQQQKTITPTSRINARSLLICCVIVVVTFVVIGSVLGVILGVVLGKSIAPDPTSHTPLSKRIDANGSAPTLTTIEGLPVQQQQQQQKTITPTSRINARSLLICCVIVVVTFVVIGSVLGVILGVVLDNRNDGTTATSSPPADPDFPPVVNPPPAPRTTILPPPPTFVEGDIFETGYCGTQRAPNIRILDGYDALPGQWPWMVSMRDTANRHRCGGVLIGTRWVLTAAHCIDEVESAEDRLTSAVFGDTRISRTSAYNQAVRFSSMIIHPQWNPRSSPASQVEFDIALVDLGRSVDITNYVRPICLASLLTETTFYHSCYVAGWGALEPVTGDEDVLYPDRLQERQIPIISASECEDKASEITSDFIICDAGLNNAGTCAGDSGGPLMCKSYQDSSYHLVGITSSGVGCGSGVPAFYTRISRFVQWIKDITQP
ncbi:uncharacterized protein [Amphiura filiformis]|uniref:uncharacterized protein n=1 Tax=Amphiura filiformis TaxID=82378 RepID=UPI003B20DB1F